MSYSDSYHHFKYKVNKDIESMRKCPANFQKVVKLSETRDLGVRTN